MRPEDEPTLAALAALIRREGWQSVLTFKPQGPGDICVDVWSSPAQVLYLDWEELVEKFGVGWMDELNRLLNTKGQEGG